MRLSPGFGSLGGGGAADGDAGGGGGALLDRLEVGGRLQEGDRVDRLAVDPDFVMEVASGRAAGRAHQADHVAALDALAGGDQRLGKVAVAGLDAVAVLELDEVAVAAAIIFGAADEAVGGGVDGGSDRSGEVDSDWEAGLACAYDCHYLTSPVSPPTVERWLAGRSPFS